MLDSNIEPYGGATKALAVSQRLEDITRKALADCITTYLTRSEGSSTQHLHGYLRATLDIAPAIGINPLDVTYQMARTLDAYLSNTTNSKEPTTNGT